MHILQPYLSAAVSSDEDFEKAKAENYSEIYRLTDEGIHKYHKLNREGTRFISIKVPSIPGLPLMKAPKVEVNFLPDGKIPRSLFDDIVGLYRAVMKENQGRNLEAMAWILWNKDDGYFIHVPKQTVSAASVQYDWDVPAGSIVVVDTH